MRSRKNNARVCKSKVKKGVNIDRSEKRMVKNKEVRKWGMMTTNTKRHDDKQHQERDDKHHQQRPERDRERDVERDRRGWREFEKWKDAKRREGRGRSTIAIVNICGAIFNEIDLPDMTFPMMMKMTLDGLLLGVDVNGMIMINSDFNG